MIGLSALTGKLNPTKDYIEIFKNIHEVNGLEMFSYKYSDDKFVCTLTMRKELADEKMNSCFWEDDEYVVFIDGYICMTGNNNSARYVLNGWLNEESNFIRDLNGEYTICIYYKKSNEIFFLNDRFASRKLYYLNKKNCLFLASEKKAIFAAQFEKPQICNNGLMEVFTFSHNLQDTTIFQDLKVLPPGSILTLKRHKLTIRKYWKLQYNENYNRVEQNELIQNMAVTLKNAAEKKYRGRNKFGMGLSGGLDSRVVAVTFPSDIRPFFARTFGEKNSSEVQIAGKIAKRLNFNHHIHTTEQLELSKMIYPIVWRSECEIPFINLLSLASHFELKDKMLYNLGGQFGDVLTDLKPLMFFPTNRRRFIEEIFSYYTERTYRNKQNLKRIFNPVFFDENFNLVRESFYNSLDLINSDKRLNLYTIWDLTNRQARFTFGSSSVDNYVFQKILLFTDYDYVDIMLGVDPFSRLGQTLYKKMIITHFDIIRDIPYSHTNKLIKNSSISNLKDFYIQYYKNKKRKKRIYTEGSGKANLIRRDKGLKVILDSFVSDSSFPSEIFSKEGIIKTVEEHYSGEKNFDYLLGILLTFIAAFNLFILNNFKRMPDYAHPFQIKQTQIK